MMASLRQEPIHSAYKDSPVAIYHEWIESKPSLSGDAVKAAEVIWKVASLPDPPLRLSGSPSEEIVSAF